MNRLIIIDKDILSGTPVISGTRVPVKNLFDYLETGESLETFLVDFPSVKKDQAIALLVAAQKLLMTSSEILYEDIA
ncbi:MAG: DUF433 domain-containing protein [Bacteroidales bacterium]|nr:DUF433 domain-containing protein [Bacteroidales bacterium]